MNKKHKTMVMLEKHIIHGPACLGHLPPKLLHLSLLKHKEDAASAVGQASPSPTPVVSPKAALNTSSLKWISPCDPILFYRTQWRKWDSLPAGPVLMLQSNTVKAECKHYFHGMLTEAAVIFSWLSTQESQMITN